MLSHSTVYFFGTCLIDLFYPSAGLAGMQLLRREGIRVIYPSDQGCCGQPAFNSGYREEALKVARAQLALFKQAYPIVVPSASCAGMIKHHWPALFEGQADHPLACAIAERTYELTAFLTQHTQLQLTDLGPPIEVAVHTSCSARREMGVGEHLEQLLGQLQQVTIKHPQHAEECCGFGGTFVLKQAEISAAMTEAKCQALNECDAELIVSQDCGCLMNLGGFLDKQKSALKTQHIAEFLWQRTEGHPIT